MMNDDDVLGSQQIGLLWFTPRIRETRSGRHPGRAIELAAMPLKGLLSKTATISGDDVANVITQSA